MTPEQRERFFGALGQALRQSRGRPDGAVVYLYCGEGDLEPGAFLLGDLRAFIGALVTAEEANSA